MSLSKEEVQHIALLARLGLSEADVEKFRMQLSQILQNFEILNEVDTANLEATAQSIPLHNVFRADDPKESYPLSDILLNAPQQEGGYFKVKAVLE